MQVVSMSFDKRMVEHQELEKELKGWTCALVTYGSCIYRFPDYELLLNKGQLLIVPGHLRYEVKNVAMKMHEKYVVRFTIDQLFEPLPMLQTDTALSYTTSKFDLFDDRFRYLYQQWMEKSDYYITLCEALLKEIVVSANREWDQGMPLPSSTYLADQMKSYIHNHYREHVTKYELAEWIKRSPNHAATMFRKVTGQTISEYVHAIRIKTAVYMLKHSVLTIAEISEFVGYQDVTYFYRLFKRQTEKSPTDYLAEREETRR